MSILKRNVRGFSLIELAVVVAIIGILAAIAIPTFLGQRKGAQDRSAQSDLRNVAVQGRATAAANNSLYDSAVVGTLNGDEPALAISSAAAATDGSVDVSAQYLSPTVIGYAALSDSGTCWFVFDDLDLGTSYGMNDNIGVAADNSLGCDATNFVLNGAAVTLNKLVVTDANGNVAVGADDFAAAVDLNGSAV